ATGLDAADYVLRTVEQEASACHTVSYTTALALLAALASALGPSGDLRHEMEEIPDMLALLLGQESWEELAARFADRRRYWLVALAHEGDDAIAPLAAETIALPPVNELLSPILAVVPLQLFTYHLALLRRVNPDTMRADQPAHGRARAGLTL